LVWYPTRNLFLWSGSLAKSDASRTWHNVIAIYIAMLIHRIQRYVNTRCNFLPVGGLY
jgi:hypothetical protein